MVFPPSCTVWGFSQLAQGPWATVCILRRWKPSLLHVRGLRDKPGPDSSSCTQGQSWGARVLPLRQRSWKPQKLLKWVLRAMRCQWLLWEGVRSRGTPAQLDPVPWGLQQAGGGGYLELLAREAGAHSALTSFVDLIRSQVTREMSSCGQGWGGTQRQEESWGWAKAFLSHLDVPEHKQWVPASWTPSPIIFPHPM